MSMDAANKPQRELQIQREKNQAFQESECLSARIKDLASRLDPVLRNPEPQAEKSKAEVETALVPLASDFREVGRNIHKQAWEIEDILERLEL